MLCSPFIAFNDCFNVCIYVSAKSLVARFYGTVSSCLIPFNLRNVAKSLEVNCVPLSHTDVWQISNRTNIERKIVIVLLVVSQEILLAIL